MRDDFIPARTSCIGGVNEQVEKAKLTECADARNVWVKDGVVQQRPGYVGVGAIPGGGVTTANFSARSEDVSSPTPFTNASGAGVLTLNGLVGRTTGVDGDRWYLGHSATFNGCYITVVNVNSTATQFIAEYYNGTTWQWLIVTEAEATAPVVRIKHLTPSTPNENVYFRFAAPADWALTSVNSQSAYWIRFTLLDADLDGAVEIDVAGAGSAATNNAADIRGHFVAKFPATKRYLTVANNTSDNLELYLSGDEVQVGGYVDYPFTGAKSDEPATMAVVPEFDEAYIAYGHRVTAHKAYPLGAGAGDPTYIHASVEARPEIVGANAKYSTSYIAQLGDFPRAKYISYFKGLLWASGLEDDPHGIRWSAPGFAYKVWPLLSRETLAENDNSEVKAQYGFGESMLVWKNDSMWQMQYTGINAFGLLEFKPQRIPGAVGCVSQASVIEIHGKVYWLAEDGVYSFDGVRVKPVFKERIQSIFRRINPSRRAFAVGVDWAPYNMYLLAVAVDGATANNLVLGYDYNEKAWWIWDSIEAQFWLADEDSADNFALYFGDASGRIYEFGKGLTDHGAAIESYVVTQRMARVPLNKTKTLRRVSVLSNNLAQSLTVEVRGDDEASGDSATKDYTDPFEVDYGEAVTASVYVPDRMRTRGEGFRKDGRHFQVKVTHSTKNTPFTLHGIETGHEMKGSRR